MKTKFHLTMTLIVAFIFCIISCSNENEGIKDFQVRSVDNCTESSIEELKLAFCLLDSMGVAKTQFKEGENIVFSLALTNTSKDTIIIKQNIIDEHFFRVTEKSQQQNMGTPQTGAWCEFSNAPREIVIGPSETFQLTCPWILTKSLKPVYPLCKGQSNEYLPIGEYDVEHNLNFSFTVSQNEISTNNDFKPKITFTIN
ncbi:MAG TPA: hypothetical protein DEF18_05175 [Muricauda sp.]|uniref:Uncharacterized protein n=1 Tax=Flagellimonas sediminis TaxID=2696468 RepID=A0A6I5KYU8_9FLAO|nr:hypothetical protein [Allomuricauda sediminis]MBC73049.1 hypothetical protein [Allomuricauda sp.]NDV42070.1 hypothetical protein [Allomuricauda sediminis]HBU77474.1 hypothetical protein [Allomuricauda sp.]|tara:strand:+ start:2637 stop:3233 length:597 start_codon:yes stop_codon:yes gene_type:complete